MPFMTRFGWVTCCCLDIPPTMPALADEVID
jgi:hypothetical protein